MNIPRGDTGNFLSLRSGVLMACIKGNREYKRWKVMLSYGLGDRSAMPAGGNQALSILLKSRIILDKDRNRSVTHTLCTCHLIGEISNINCLII